MSFCSYMKWAIRYGLIGGCPPAGSELSVAPRTGQWSNNNNKKSSNNSSYHFKRNFFFFFLAGSLMLSLNERYTGESPEIHDFQVKYQEITKAGREGCLPTTNFNKGCCLHRIVISQHWLSFFQSSLESMNKSKQPKSQMGYKADYRKQLYNSSHVMNNHLVFTLIVICILEAIQIDIRQVGGKYYLSHLQYQ